MVKLSAHFTNALKREHERLTRRHDAVSAKIGKLVDEQNDLTNQMKSIDDQLGEQPEVAAEPEQISAPVTIAAKGGIAA